MTLRGRKEEVLRGAWNTSGSGDPEGEKGRSPEGRGTRAAPVTLRGRNEEVLRGVEHERLRWEEKQIGGSRAAVQKFFCLLLFTLGIFQYVQLKMFF